MKRKQFAVMTNWAGSTFVKEWDFYVGQGGLRDPWGRAWRPVMAFDIEHARQKGRRLYEADLRSSGRTVNGHIWGDVVRHDGKRVRLCINGFCPMGRYLNNQIARVRIERSDPCVR